MFIVDDDNAKTFLNVLEESIKKVAPATMLSKGICANYTNGIEKLKTAAIQLVQSDVAANDNKTEAAPYIFTVTQKQFMANKKFSQRSFWPR